MNLHPSGTNLQLFSDESLLLSWEILLWYITLNDIFQAENFHFLGISIYEAFFYSFSLI